MRSQTEKLLVAFDSECVACSSWVRFVLRRDRGRRIFFTSLKGELGRQLLDRYNVNVAKEETMLLIAHDRCWERSDAFLMVFSLLPWPWRALSWLRRVPRTVRDWVYRLFARNRYRLFGRSPVCLMASFEADERLLDSRRIG